MNQESLNEVIKLHKRYLAGSSSGICLDLPNENLHGLDLHGAVLCDAKLDGASLREADLHGADLRMANLRGANLYKANLYMANLRGANLYKANLYRVDLSGADLREADLREANIHEVTWCDANLDGAKIPYRGQSITVRFEPEESESDTPREDEPKIFCKGPARPSSVNPNDLVAALTFISEVRDNFLKELQDGLN